MDLQGDQQEKNQHHQCQQRLCGDGLSGPFGERPDRVLEQDEGTSAVAEGETAAGSRGLGGER